MIGRFLSTLSTRLLALATVLFILSSALAKTDKPADPGSGTGGIRITSYTATVGGNDGQGGGKAYDEGTRKIGHMPQEWFICKTDADCDLVPVLCNPSLAVSKLHKQEARTAQCAAVQTCGPKASCVQSVPNRSRAVCINRECRTVFMPAPD